MNSTISTGIAQVYVDPQKRCIIIDVFGIDRATWDAVPTGAAIRAHPDDPSGNFWTKLASRDYAIQLHVHTDEEGA